MRPPRFAPSFDLLRVLGAAGIFQGSKAQRRRSECEDVDTAVDSQSTSCADFRYDGSLRKRTPALVAVAAFAGERTRNNRSDYVLAHSPTTSAHVHSSTEDDRDFAEPAPSKQYDFIVVGHGAAGRAAVQALARQCPSASIAVIDPLLDARQASSQTKELLGNHNIGLYSQSATFLNPRQRTVRLASRGGTAVTISKEGTQAAISYRHAILLATGARGAPIPHYIHDDTAQSRILTWRAASSSENDLLDSANSLPEQIQHHVLQSASRGSKIAVLGSGWDAVALSLYAATASQRNKRPMLIMGASGPLSHVLPNYLVNAVTKRLKSKHVFVKDRTLIRYISEAPPANNNGSETYGKRQPHLQIYTAKSFDFMDSHVDMADWVVVAPDATGPRGSASLDTGVVPDHLDASGNGRRWYQSWSDMTRSSTTDVMSIACYQEDGRLAVNAELSACSGVFAAGSVAKYPNSYTGHADVAGEGIDEAANAGNIAAYNMALGYQAAYPSISFRNSSPTTSPLTIDPIPIFRTDTVLCGNDGRSVLSDNGINAVLVGHCDAERFYTVGIWWTNQAGQRRILAEPDQDNSPNLRHRKSLAESPRPVYGLGIVYYFDRTGRLQGILAWGLPSAKGNDKNNNDLVDKMKHMIRTNGGFRSVESDLEQMRMTKYLTLAGSNLVRHCLRPSNDKPADNEELPRPLVRFTQVRRNSIRTGILKRKEGASFGVLGEDLFARYQGSVDEVAISRPDMSRNVGYAAQQAQDQYDWNVWEQKEAQWEENEAIARPPREDALWIRKGDEVRQTSAKDNLLAAFNKALWGHSS